MKGANQLKPRLNLSYVYLESANLYANPNCTFSFVDLMYVKILVSVNENVQWILYSYTYVAHSLHSYLPIAIY